MIARLASLFPVSLALLAATPAAAQEPAAAVIAVPPLTTPDNSDRGAGGPAAIAWQATQLIASDLRSTAELVPVGPNQKDYYSYPEVTAPTFSRWRNQGRWNRRRLNRRLRWRRSRFSRRPSGISRFRWKQLAKVPL